LYSQLISRINRALKSLELTVSVLVSIVHAFDRGCESKLGPCAGCHARHQIEAPLTSYPHLRSKLNQFLRIPFKMLVSLTVGKVDAGMAVLLTEDKRIVRLSRLRRLSKLTSNRLNSPRFSFPQTSRPAPLSILLSPATPSPKLPLLPHLPNCKTRSYTSMAHRLRPPPSCAAATRRRRPLSWNGIPSHCRVPRSAR
jgi:hypothetical protein